MASNTAYINLINGSLPATFNPATFKSQQVQADAVQTTTLQVSSTALTNGIVDATQIDAKRLAVATEAQFSGLLVPNSSCLATTYYVDNKIDALLGGTGIPTLLDSITEISQALNNDPDFAGTIGARVGQVEVAVQNNANALGQSNAEVELITETLLSLDTRLTNAETDIGDLQTSAGEIQAAATALTGRVSTAEGTLTSHGSTLSGHTTSISTNTSAISGLDTRLGTAESTLSSHTTSIGTNTGAIAALDTRVGSAEGTLTSHTTSISTNTSAIGGLDTRLGTAEGTIASHTSTLSTHAGTLSTNTSDIGALDVRVGAAEGTISGHTSSISSINTALTNKADKANPTFTGTATFANITTQSLIDNGNCTIKGNTAIGDSATDTLTVKGTATFNHAVVVQGSNVKTALDGHDTAISSINSALAGKAEDSAVVHLTGNETVAGIKTFSSAPKIGINEVATTYDVSVAINNLINAAPGTLDTLGEIATVLQNNVNEVGTITSTMVNLAGTQTISGAKAFSTAPTVPTQTQGNNSTYAANTAYVDAAVSGLSTSVASTYLPSATAASTYQPVSGMSDYLTTASASSTYQTQAGMSSYLTTSAAASTYQPAGSYLTSSVYGATNTWTGANEFQADHITNKTVEKYAAGTVSSNAFSVNYASNTNNTYAITPSSANNISLTITNVPTDRGLNVVCFTFLINTATNKQYINALNVNGSSITMKAAGGLSNISVHASATLVVQHIYLQMNGATVTNAITTVTSCF